MWRLCSLNAPYDAPCFLTKTAHPAKSWSSGLNAPYGAPRFLTHPRHRRCEGQGLQVLMHLMALRAF